MAIHDQNKMLDMDALTTAFMGDKSIIKQILNAFQDTFKDFQQEFERLHQEHNLPELSRLVHGLKGSSANIRASYLSAQAATLQQQIDQNQDYTTIYQDLISALSGLNQEIDAFAAGDEAKAE